MEGGLVERLCEDVGNHDLRADPEGRGDQVQVLLAAVLDPALIVPVALRGAGVRI